MPDEAERELAECPGGFMGRDPGKHFWSVPNHVTGQQECLWCSQRRGPVVIDAELARRQQDVKDERS